MVFYAGITLIKADCPGERSHLQSQGIDFQDDSTLVVVVSATNSSSNSIPEDSTWLDNQLSLNCLSWVQTIFNFIVEIPTMFCLLPARISNTNHNNSCWCNFSDNTVQRSGSFARLQVSLVLRIITD